MDGYLQGPAADPRQRTIRRAVLAALLLILVSLAATATYLLYGPTNLAPTPPPETRGTVYFAAATRDAPALNVHQYDFDTDTFALGSEEFENPAYLRQGAAISPDGSELAYFNAVAATATATSRETPRASAYRLIRYLVADPETFSMHATSSGGLSVFPEWSPDGRSILFERFEGSADTEADTENIDQWGIYLLSEEGTERRLATGSSPKWAPDGTSILYLATDGIYRHELRTDTSSRVLSPLGDARWGWTRIDVSTDGTRLAVTPDAQRVELFEIISWEPFDAQLSATANRPHVRHWWPQFSPDGTQLATIDWEQISNDGTDVAASLAVYLTSGEFGNAPFIEAVPLDRFDLAARYLSDWR